MFKGNMFYYEMQHSMQSLTLFLFVLTVDCNQMLCMYNKGSQVSLWKLSRMPLEVSACNYF